MSIQYEYLSPGTYIREEDLSARLAAATSTSGAAVYESKRGPTDLTFYSSGRQFLTLNGPADPTVSFAHDCIPAFLLESNNFWGKRETNGALYAGTTYFIDRRSKNAPAADANGNYAGRLLHSDLVLGSIYDYTGGIPPFVVLSFSDVMTSGQVFAMSITDGETLQPVNVPWTTDWSTTLGAINQGISQAMAQFADGGTVEAHVEITTGATPNMVLIIRPPSSASLFFNTPTITVPAVQGQPAPAAPTNTCFLDTDAAVIHFLAENPGEWANDVGVQITNVDVGIRQRFQITFSGPLVVGNSFSGYINNVLTPTVTFATDSDTTMAAIATMLQSNPAISSATVSEVPGARNNDRVIVLVANVAGPGALQFGSCVVTGGASQPAVLSRETLSGKVSTGEFDVLVFEQPNLNRFVERFTCTLNKAVNPNGEQTQIDQQINVIASRSNYIRVMVPDSNRDYVFQPTVVNNVNMVDTTINFLAAGDDGVACLATQIADSWMNNFKNREVVPTTLFLNCGYTDVYIQQTMVAVCEYRFDAFAILDMASTYQQTQDAYNHRLQDLNIDSSYGAIYTPDLQIRDDTTNELRYIPPSGHVGACYAASDRDYGLWFAPAGVNRGKLALVQGLREAYDQGDRDLLNPVGVNCIINKPGIGPVIWGEETLQIATSVLSAVHARRLMNRIEVGYADGLNYTVLFDPNNSYTQFKAYQLGDSILAPIKNAEGIYDYALVTDGRINTDDVINDEEMRVDVYVDITRTAKRIILTGILTSAGAQFAELISARGSTF